MALLHGSVWTGIMGFLFLTVLFLWYRKEKDSRGLMMCLVLSFCVLGLIRGTAERWKYEQDRNQETESQMGQVLGRIRKLEEKELSWGITLTDCHWRGKSENREGSGEGSYEEALSVDVQVWIRKELLEQQDLSLEQLRPGRKVVAEGERQRPESARNPGGFDYDSYYRSSGIGWQMFGERVRPADSGQIPWKEQIFLVKQWAEKRFEQLCQPEDLGVFQAALLGEKRNLDEELRKLYQDNGIAHLLAISGLHISMIGLGFYRILRKCGLGYGAAGIAGAAVILMYGELTGFSSSVFRAVFMLLCYMLAEYLGRGYDLLSAASLSAILLLLESPYLVLQAGFQLSFGAVTAIGGAAPWLLEQWKDSSVSWKKAVFPGLAIQLVTGPVILYHFYQFPVYGIFLNLLVIPLMTYVVLSGILGLFFSCFSMTLGQMAIGSGHYILKFYTWLCEWCETLPGANLILGQPELWQILGYYLFLLLIFWWIKLDHEKQMGKNGKNHTWREETRRAAVFGAGIFCCFVLLHPLPQRGLDVTFLDVGQGDGICIQADGSVILMDGGSSSEKEVGKTVLEPFLKSQGIQKIDYAIVSHADQDHINGLVYLLEEEAGISINSLVLPWLGQGEEIYEELVKKVDAKGTYVHWMQKGEQICQRNLSLSCVYHGKEERKEEKNEHSLVFSLSYGANRVILTGDMSEAGEWDILEEGALRTEKPVLTCLKVAHHGSRYSSCSQWLEDIAPSLAVISCGEDNVYGHPHVETMKRLEEEGITVWQTKEKGAVFLQSDGNTMKVDSMCGISH